MPAFHPRSFYNETKRHLTKARAFLKLFHIFLVLFSEDTKAAFSLSFFMDILLDST